MESFFNSWFISSMQASILIVFIICLNYFFKNKLSLKIKSFLWALVIVRLLIPFSFETPFHMQDLFVQTSEPETMYSVDTVQNNYAANTPTTYNSSNYNYSAENNDYPATTNVAEENIAENQTVTASPFSGFTIYTWLFFIWLFGTFLFLQTIIYQLVTFNRKVKKTATFSNAIAKVYLEAKASLGLKKDIIVIESSHTDVPITYGLVNPKILLPKNMVNQLDENKLQLIIMHELCHIQKLDTLKNYFWLIAKAIHWFNPLVWIGYNHFMSHIELTCDDAIIKKINSTQKYDYTQSLLEMTKFIQPNNSKATSVMLTFCENKSKIRRRIMNILEPEKKSKPVLYLTIGITIILLFACFTTACQSASEQLNSADIVKATATPTPNEPSPTPIVIPTPIGGGEEVLIPNSNPETTPLVFNIPLGEILWDETREIDGADVEASIELVGASSPANNLAPIIEIKLEDFDEEFAKKAADYFLGDEYYDGKYTKDDYDIMISETEKFYESLSDEDKELFDAEDVIASFKKEQKTAPSKNTEPKFEFSSIDGYGTLFSLKSYPKSNCISQFQIGNSIYDSNFFDFSRGDFKYHEKLEIPLEEARKQADAAVEFFTDNMVISSYQLIPTSQPYIHGFSQPNGETYVGGFSTSEVFAFYYTPSYGGVSSLFGQDTYGTINEQVEKNMYLEESIKVIVDDEGIVRFTWINKSKGIKTISSNTDIIDFASAVEVFKQEFFTSRTWASENETAKIKITYIELCLVNKQNDDGSYYMVPAYAFKGTKTLIDANGKETIVYDESDEACFLIVNAIDGSIINATLGIIEHS